MWLNWLKTSVRNLRKHNGYTIINVCGLAVALAICLLAYMYISFELSYDMYHRDADRVYRITATEQVGANRYPWAAVGEPLGPAVRQAFPNLGSVARVQDFRRAVIRSENLAAYESKLLLADPQIFDVLTVHMLEGESESALLRPGTVVLTETMAAKYFPGTRAMGRTLQVNGEEYEVTGVAADPPPNTHLAGTGWISFSSIEPHDNMMNWGRMSTFTYVKLREGLTAQRFEDDLNRVVGAEANLAWADEGEEMEFHLQWIGDIHLYSDLNGEYTAPGNPARLYVYGLVGLLVLGVALVNLINLSTARSGLRIREVGVRKSIGATRRQLITQFMGEAGLLLIIATVFAVILVEIFLPGFNKLSGLELSTGHLFQYDTIMAAILLGLAATLASGFYPAVVMASFRPTDALKASPHAGLQGSAVRRIVVIAQFSVAVVLIFSSLAIYRQVDFMKNRPCGFDKEQTLVVGIPEDRSLADDYNLVKNEFMACRGVVAAASSSNVPGQDQYIHEFRPLGSDVAEPQVMFHTWIDHDFIPMYDIELLAGRNFDHNKPTDLSHAVLVNETGIRQLGWSSPQEALGQTVMHGEARLTVVGVTDDYHFSGMQHRVGPLVIEMTPSRFKHLSLKVHAADIQQTVAGIRDKWHDLFPGAPFVYSFLDASFDLQYRRETQLGWMALAVTAISILISSLGLMSLASFAARRRTKEIGIRKVMGASLPSIIGTLTREFALLVLIANVLALPVGHYIAGRWLEDFAHRVDLGPATYALAAAAALITSGAAIGYEAFRAARANPVESLRYE
jgi:putative ABC transport system permease protein